MTAIYILWLREVKRYLRSTADHRVAGAAAALLLVLGFGLSPVFSSPGRAASSSSAPAWSAWGSCYVDLLGDRPALGSAVRVSEGDAGRAGAADSDHGWPHAWRRDDRDDPGHAGIGGLHDRRIPSASWACYRPSLHGADGRVRGAGDGDRLHPEGHAGVSVHHELPGHADLLPAAARFREEFADGASCHRLDPLSTASTACAARSSACPRSASRPTSVVLAVVATAFLVLGARAFSRIQI